VIFKDRHGLLVVFLLLSACAPKLDDVEKTVENGVEVVVNRLEPYKIKGEPNALHLEELFALDTEKDDVVRFGVSDIRAFDVDSGGNIYVFQERESDRNLVYKFDPQGRFIAPFGKRGQGPDEILSPIFLNLTGQDEIPIQDRSGRPKLWLFGQKGNVITTFGLDAPSLGLAVFSPLPSGKFLRFRDYPDLSLRHRYDILELCDSKFGDIKELGRCDYGLMGRFASEVRGTPRVFIIEVKDGTIYLGDENRGYEVLAFDFDGNLVRKIRKKYDPAPAPEEFKKIVRMNFELSKDKLVIPDVMPPFHYFFLDDDRRLYVKTYERGLKPGEYWHDVFNPEGVFIARASLPGHGSWMYPGRDLNRARAKNGRFYCLREKETGFVELAVYRLAWK